MPQSRNNQSGKFMGVLTEADKQQLETLVATGTDLNGFVSHVVAAYQVKFTTASAWFYKAKNKKWS